MLLLTLIMSCAGGAPSGSNRTMETFSAGDPLIRYTGRVDRTDPENPVIGWTGSSAIIAFEGSSLLAEISSHSSNEFMLVFIDDNEPVKIRLSSGREPYNYLIADDLSDGEHVAEIMKITEPFEGHISFHSFSVSRGGSLLAPPSEKVLKLEFYGDSDSSGYSSEHPADSGNPIHTNSFYAFPAQTARLLGGEFNNMGWGGLGLAVTSTKVFSIWDRALPRKSDLIWDFNQYIPDYVIVNLGSNDTWNSDEEEAVRKGWRDFLKELRKVYGNVPVVFAAPYGWNRFEPARYLEDFIMEMKDEGEEMVSHVLFPFLWGQEHAVVEEQAFFSEILAAHIADILGLDNPGANANSSRPGENGVFNGDFEITAIGYGREQDPSGWRKANRGGLSYLKKDDENAQSGNHYMELMVRNRGVAILRNTILKDVTPGQSYRLSGYMKALSGDQAQMKLIYRDRGLNIIGESSEDPFIVTKEWMQFSTEIPPAPEEAISLSVELIVNQKNTTVCFDNMKVTSIQAGR